MGAGFVNEEGSVEDDGWEKEREEETGRGRDGGLFKEGGER